MSALSSEQIIAIVITAVTSVGGAQIIATMLGRSKLKREVESIAVATLEKVISSLREEIRHNQQTIDALRIELEKRNKDSIERAKEVTQLKTRVLELEKENKILRQELQTFKNAR